MNEHPTFGNPVVLSREAVECAIRVMSSEGEASIEDTITLVRAVYGGGSIVGHAIAVLLKHAEVTLNKTYP